MNDNKLRAAVVGVGYLGTFHAQKYKNNNRVTLIGVCDHSPAQSDKVAADLGVRSFHKPADLVGEVDLVTIAASTLSHYDLAKLFLQNGIHVNVEKPMTATLEQADELIALAEAQGLKLAVGHIERFNPAVIELKRHLVKPRLIELTRRATFKARGADVSVLHDLMIHDLDMLMYLSGSDVASFTATGSKMVSSEVDIASVSCVMKNGVHGIINVSRVASTLERTARVVEEKVNFVVNTGTLEIEKAEKGPGGDEPVKFTRWSVDKKDALQSETDAFVDCVLHNTIPVVTGLDGRRALQLVEEILKVIEAG